jgi:RNA polymerase sigma-70 factor (ECF subfamily)
MSWTTTTRFPFLPITSQPSGGEGASADVEEFADTSDEKLLAFVQAGNCDALGVLFRRFARLVRSVSVRILRDEGESEDLVQELFLFIYRGTASYDNAKSSARSWIVQMTYRRAISRWRYLNARGHYRNAELDCCRSAPVSVVALTYDSSIEALLGRHGLKKVMEELTAEQHETLRLHFYEGYTLAEIGKKLGQSLGNVRHHYYRGLGKLRKQMQESKLQNC